MLRNRLAIVVFLLPWTAFAGPRDELLRLVPDDYTFCLVAQNLRDAIGKSEPKLTNAPFLKLLQDAPEAKQVRDFIAIALREFEVTPEQLRDDIFGDAVVLAYRKASPGKADAEDGLGLIHARDPKLLARLMDRVNELQIKGGEIKSVEPGRGYMRRLKADGSAVGFYSIDGSTLVYATREELIQSTLAKKTLTGEPLVTARLKKLGVDDAPLVGLVNPRSFDADLADGMKSVKGSEQAFVAQFRRCIQAVESAAVFVRAGESIEIGLAVHAKPGDLPAPVAKLFAEAGRQSPLWENVPPDALFAAVGHLPIETLAGALGTFLTADDRAKVLTGMGDIARPFLESDDLSQLARGLGPDIALWVTAPDPADQTWVPRALLVARADSTATATSLKGLDFLARLACLSNPELRVKVDGGITSLSAPKLFPPGFSPSFTSKGGFVIVGSSPATVASFKPPINAATDAVDVPLIRVSVRGWKSYLTTHRTAIANFLGERKGQDAKAIAEQIDAALPILEAIDQIELLRRVGPDRVAIVLRVK